MIEVKSGHLALIVPLLFVVGIGSTMALGVWLTSSSKEPAKYTSGELKGQANPGDIRGSYTFGDVVAAFPGVPLDVLGAAFGVQGNAAAFPVKGLEAEGEAGALGVGTDSVRLFVARYLGLPYEPEPATGLSAAAVELIAAKGKADTAQMAELRKRIVALASTTQAAAEKPAAVSTPAPAPGPTPAAAPAASEDRTVKGKTTFGDLAGWGVPSAEIEKALGGTGARTVTIRDYCAERGLEFADVRDKIQKLVDAAGAR